MAAFASASMASLSFADGASENGSGDSKGIASAVLSGGAFGNEGSRSAIAAACSCQDYLCRHERANSKRTSKTPRALQFNLQKT
ncbi:hypothetical protein [Roseibium sp.]|uniref:hypothetical protein n=2 Tax=Roseibium sp. TaxID=1936156 RepID=UPI003D0E2BB3